MLRAKWKIRVFADHKLSIAPADVEAEIKIMWQHETVVQMGSYAGDNVWKSTQDQGWNV